MQPLLDRNVYIFHSRQRLRLVSNWETLKPDGAYPTDNIITEQGEEDYEGEGVWDK